MENLPLEKQLTHHTFKTQVERMSLEQAKDFLIRMHEFLIMREEMYKQTLKNSWNSDISSWLD